MLTLLEGEASRFLVAMRMDLSAELPKIMADRVQLQQVFMNLMLNAIEAVKDSGGELTVKSELQDGQTPVFGQRQGRGVANGEDGSDLFCVLYHQAAGQRHVVGHQPFHCGVAWRAVVGKRQQWTRCNLSFHFADRGAVVVASGYLCFWSWAYSALACR
jgi:signal transduction histidine kinase